MNYKSFTQSNSSVHFDAGLRHYMSAIYKNMAIGLLITGLIAMFVASSPALMALFFGTPLSWVVILAPVGMALYLGFRFQNMTPLAVRNLFYAYSAAMGLSLAFIFLAYTGESIARIFFVTASVFGAMSIYGYTTKKDLTKMGAFLFMALIGVIISSLVNIFLQSSGLNFIISIVSVLLFTGLTAYDTQRLKDLYFELSGSDEIAEKMAYYGALTLYMDFINLFMALLRLFGDRRSE
jgi:FtsH-binding integral membrane protein